MKQENIEILPTTSEGSKSELTESGIKSPPQNTQKEEKTSFALPADWKMVRVGDISFAIPQNFTPAEGLAQDSLAEKLFWPPDRSSPMHVTMNTAPSVCDKPLCVTPEELTKVSAEEAYARKTDPANIPKHPQWKFSYFDLAGGRQGFLANLYQDKNISLHFVHKNALYVISQTDANKYLIDGKPIIFTVFSSLKFE